MGYPLTAAALAKMRSEIEKIEGNAALYLEPNCRARAEAIESIQSRIIRRIDKLLEGRRQDRQLRALHQRADALRQRLEQVDEQLYERLRGEIRSRTLIGGALRRELVRYVAAESACRSGPHRDAFDSFLNGLLQSRTPPSPTRQREPEMVYYVQTPTRFVLEMIERAPIAAGDVFYDVGSGLGQVVILVALLTGARAVGIEYEPAYCQHAQVIAESLEVPNVRFLNQDAREASYADATVLFLYTPFLGQMLQQVLGLIEPQARERPLTICTYGPCTHQVATQSWLRRADSGLLSDHRLAIFTTRL